MKRPFERRPGRFPGERRCSIAAGAGGAFPPGRLFFGIGAENYSPALLKKIVRLGGNSPSFERAEQDISTLLEFCISARHIQTLTERVGSEMAGQSRRQADEWLRHAGPASPLRDAPLAVAVAVDDGKLHLRAEEQPPGVHDPKWRNYKAAHLMTVRPKHHRDDPAPDPPAAFTERANVEKLVAELAKVRSDRHSGPSDPAGATSPAKSALPRAAPAKVSRQLPSPDILLRSYVVTHADPERFGARVAAEAHKRRFFDAAYRAFLGDGSPGNWTLHDEYFPGFLPLLDFLHLLAHLFAAARRDDHSADWPFYARLIRLAWAGKTLELLALLRRRANGLGPLPDNARADDPRNLLAETLNYVETNRDRMDYPRARRLGLPLTSSHVESLINAFNYRVKASSKFWCPQNVEAVLHVRAACLSDLPEWDNFWCERGRLQRGLIRPRRQAA
jgi:hypothetical protein